MVSTIMNAPGTGQLMFRLDGPVQPFYDDGWEVYWHEWAPI